MTFSLGSLPSEITPPNLEGLRSTNRNLLVPKPFAKGPKFLRNDSTRVLNNEAREVVISSEMLSGQLEGSYIPSRRMKEPRRQLEFVRTLLIDNYDSYTYNIYQELSVVNGLPPVVVRNDEWTWRDIYHYVYEENAFDNIVISPGPGSPTCAADIGICLTILLECRDIPILGVCLGHQALGFVNGAEVVHAPQPVHGRLSEIEHTGCGLFNKIPSGKNSGFKVVRYHSLVIDPDSLPKELIPMAWTCSGNAFSFLGNQRSELTSDSYGSCLSQQVPNNSPSSNSMEDFPLSSRDSEVMQSAKVLMGIKHSSRPHYGLQFHPESVATCYGRQIFKNFREITEDYWMRLGPSPRYQGRHRQAACMQVPEASCLLRDFSRQLAKNLGENKESGLCHREKLSNRNSDAKFLKLQWRKLESLASQVGGARSIFCELFGDRKGRNTFWLDSSSVEKRRARFSFMGGKGGSLWKQVTFTLSNRSDATLRDGGYLSTEDANGSTNRIYLKDGFFDFLNKELQSFCYDAQDFEALPFDFHGGYIGYIGYDLKAECGTESNRHKSGTPDACFFFSDQFIVIDHDNNDIYVMSLTDRSTSNQTAWLDHVEQKLLGLKTCASTIKLASEDSQLGTNSSFKTEFVAEKSREHYIEDVKKCQEFIEDGESYELCLTTQMRKIVGDIDSLGLYLRLREKNPAPYAAWLNFSNEDLCICCSSPERFLRLDRNGILEAKPIKGTVARGSTPEEDEMLKIKLQSSEKDQAENLMIVDLLRNDLGRVCEPGSVHVPHLMEVESYATVHTMVSTIRGKKRSNLSAVDCVRAAFPGGSMTGAPKLRSMELLDSLESCSRGIYSGCIGFFSYNQTFDLNIVIRTLVVHKGEASIGAGGAVVSLSNAEEEYNEMILKTKAPVNAILEFQQGPPPSEEER